MKKFWNQLNSAERRMAAGIGLVVFVVLNLWFIVPQFHGFLRATKRMEQAEKTLALFKSEIGRETTYKKLIADTLADAQDVPQDDLGINLQRGYQDRALESGVIIQRNGASVTHTNNTFFIEEEAGGTFFGTETNMVNFLYSLSSGSSLMRVKSMSLRPDPPHQNLVAALSIVASFQKKAAPKSTTLPVKSAPVSTPLANPGAKTPAATNKVKAPGGPVTNKNTKVPQQPGPANTKLPTLGARPGATNKPAASKQINP